MRKTTRRHPCNLSPLNPRGSIRSFCLAACLTWLSATTGHGQKLLSWLVTLDHHKPAIEALAAEFEARNPGVAIRLLWVPANQYSVKFKTLAAAKQTPDLFYCGDVWLAGQLPFLLDLTAFVHRDAAELELADFPPRLLEASQKNGRWFTLPRFFNVSLLYYNRGLFEEQGIALPQADWSWEEYLSAGRQLTRRNSRGEIDCWGSDVVLGWWGEWLTLVRQAGGDFLTPDLDQAILDRPEALRGISFYHAKVFTHRIAPPPGRGPATGFPSGRIAMQWGGHLGNWTIYNEFPQLDWDVEVLPSGPTGSSGGELAIESYGISKSTAHPEDAWRLLKFICSVEGVRPFAQRGFPPARLGLAEEVYSDPNHRPRNWRAAYRALESAQPIPSHPYFLELSLDIVQPEFDLMMAGKLTPEQAVRRATKAANAFIDTVGYREGGRTKAP
jgi:multiple sugar transport system substrate-binding protein